MGINNPDWYPCYLNPDFNELLELAKSGWDTCRILENPDNGDFIIASGLGNTHETLAVAYRTHLGRKRMPFTDSFILHHREGIAYMNLEDVSGNQYARYEKWPLSDKHLEILRDLIRESNLSL